MKDRIRQAILLVVTATLVIALLFVMVWTDLRYHWSGFSWFTSPLTAEQILERQKTIWDWLELLIIPAAIAISAAIFGWMERRNERRIAEERRGEDRHIADQRLEEERRIADERIKQEWVIADERLKEDRRIADERAQDAALETYLAQMSTLLLDRKLRTSEAESEELDIARTWTLTVLRRLSGERKGVVVQFLSESKLITGANSVISLRGADLADAHLEHADLAGADLEDANLGGANLERAHLAEANFWRANLKFANLVFANLMRANLKFANLEGAILARAHLEHANLSDAILVRANLKGARYSTLTRWPDGFDPVAAGAILWE